MISSKVDARLSAATEWLPVFVVLFSYISFLSTQNTLAQKTAKLAGRQADKYSATSTNQ